MIRFDIISAVPGLLESPLNHSIVQRGQDKQLVEIAIHDLRDYTDDKHRKVDDYPYGGGAGMVLMPQPVFSCVEHLKKQRDYDEIIFPAPDAPAFDQPEANRLSTVRNILIICGHYKGIDQRVRDALVTREYSFGNFVVSGGELPALMLVDAVTRLVPGVIGDAESALTDSFQDGLLGAPQYTRPAVFNNMPVPEVLLSGNHAAIEQWREKQAIEKTRKVREDLFKKFQKHT